MGIACCGKAKEENLPTTVTGFQDKDVPLKFKVELYQFKGKNFVEVCIFQQIFLCLRSPNIDTSST